MRMYILLYYSAGKEGDILRCAAPTASLSLPHLAAHHRVTLTHPRRRCRNISPLSMAVTAVCVFTQKF